MKKSKALKLAVDLIKNSDLSVEQKQKAAIDIADAFVEWEEGDDKEIQNVAAYWGNGYWNTMTEYGGIPFTDLLNWSIIMDSAIPANSVTTTVSDSTTSSNQNNSHKTLKRLFLDKI